MGRVSRFLGVVPRFSGESDRRPKNPQPPQIVKIHMFFSIFNTNIKKYF